MNTALRPALLTIAALLAAAAAGEDLRSVELSPSDVALKNPLKGWRGQIGPDYVWGEPPTEPEGAQPIGTPLETLRKLYVGWDEIEPDGGGATVETVRALLDRKLAGYPGRNIKVIPRLAIRDKYAKSRTPADLEPLDSDRASAWYDRPDVRKRIARLIAACGRAWDDDPRVAYVEMGVAGKYGEHWDLIKMPDFEQFLHKRFDAAFDAKPVMIRNAGTPGWGGSLALAEAGPYGFYQDSFGKDLYEGEAVVIAGLDRGRRWRVAPMGGEGWIVESLRDAKDRTPKNVFEQPEYVAELRRWIRRGHTNHLGSPYGDVLSAGGQTAEGREIIASLHKLMGYRFVPTAAAFTPQTEPGGRLTVSLSVRNEGSSPLYANWPLMAALADLETHEVVWSAPFEGVDLRRWLPGEGYNEQSGEYDRPPVERTAKTTFRLPKDLPAGQYAVCVFVPEHAGGRPVLRLATGHYWEGGLHPLGVAGVGQPPSATLGAESFFADGVDDSLGYEVETP